MRILQICSARSIGGGERHVADLSNELTRRGHDIFAAVVPGSPILPELSALPPENIVAFPLRNSVDAVSAIKIGKFAGKNKIELIHAHLAKDYPVAAATSRIAGIPFVITRHVLFPMNRLHRLFLREVNFVIAPSDAVAKSLRDEGIFPLEKIVTIRHGLDVGQFHVRERGNSEEFRVGTIGNLDPVKGFDILIRAAAIVAPKEPHISFAIFGEDRSRDGSNRAALEDLTAQLNLQDTVKLAGWSTDLQAELAHLDLFVSASRSESFGFAIAEAMLAGVPVVASETEGAKEIIADPSLGRLVPIGSPEALADAILDLHDDTARRDQFSAFGRRHVSENFSLKRMVDETEALYRRAIDRP